MAKGNIIQGQSSGKLGSTVLMVRNGQQVARVYTTAGAREGDQASESVRIQRVKFGSASNQWQAYKFVCTRMYRKGRQSQQSDYNYFVKRNNQLLPYLTKQENADGVHVLMPGQFSEGNLGRIELTHYYTATPSETAAVVRVSDLQSMSAYTVGWKSNLTVLKSALRGMYPNARKVTYLFSYAAEVSIVEEGESFVSQNISHYPVIIDLYSETTPGENTQPISEYFGAKIGNSTLATIFAAQLPNNAIVDQRSVFMVYKTADSDIATLGNVGVLIFASDDNVSDCYSTILPAGSVSPTSGVYSIWAAYRTTESLRVAADSYGYQSGVLRDQVAAVGNDLSDAVVTYARTLRSLDPTLADTYIEDVKAAGGPHARSIRTLEDSASE